MTKVGTWICSILDENMEIARACRNTAFALNSKNITDVVGIEITLRVNATSLTETVDNGCMRSHCHACFHAVGLKKGLGDFRG